MVNSQYKKNARFSEDFIKLKPLVAAVRWVIASGLLVGSGLTQVSANTATVGPAQLPIPVIPGFSVNTSGDYMIPDTSIAYTITDGNVAAHGNADMTIDTVAQKETINQKTDKAVIDWKSFNIAKGWTVQFKQPTSSSTALNNIHDANATQILGALTANGQVYLVNNNGFVFSKGSTVDANTLVASALNISDANFNAGIIRAFDNNPGHPTAALSGGAATNASIDVQAGANIKVGKSGNVILAAPTVNNSGSISADQQGQILLVGSQDNVYLQPASNTSPFAGLLVEVGTGGTVNNNVGGNIAVREGNITLAGFAVNQSGRLSATTSVDVNGSIRLLARENVNPASTVLSATQTVRNAGMPNEEDATVTFGSGSSTTILADANGGSAINEQAQKQSYVEVSADKIDMQSGSSIVATAGAVNMLATDNLIDPLAGTAGRIDLEKGSVIDVSGTKNVSVAMERNVVDVSVQSFNLRNAPYQRGGVLQGQTIKVDIRNLPSIFDASSALSSIKHSINERLGTGGTINLVSSGDVVVNKGAVLNISGGSVAYQGGYINTTQLIDAVTGKLVDISVADPNRQYSGIYGVYTEKHTKWGVTDSWNLLTSVHGGHYEAGYIEGKDAGTLNIQSPVTAWDGQLIAGTVTSPYQRSNSASGGSFTLNQNDNGGATNLAGVFLSAQDINFQSAPLVSQAIGINDIIDNTAPITLTTDFVNHSGINNLVLKTAGTVSVLQDAKLSLPMLSKFSVDAPVINVLGSIYTPGGTIGLNAVAGQINLGSHSELNVSGRWVNDFKEGITLPLAINAGKVNLGKISLDGIYTTSQITLDQGALIKADGGAQLNLAGNRVTAGKAGSITLNAVNILFNGPTEEKNALSAMGLTKGGSLNLTTHQINIGGNDPVALNLAVTNGALDLVANAGFNSISLSTIPTFGADITVNTNTNWTFSAKNSVLDSTFRDQAGASSLAGFSQLSTLPENMRAPVSLTLNGNTGVTLQTGSQIHVDKGSTVTLTDSQAGGGIYINGLIEALGGTINLNLNSFSGDIYNSALAIWIDSLGSLNAQGTTLLNPVDALGRQTGSVLNGGSININADRGSVVLAQGASINVNGTHASLNVPTTNSLEKSQQIVGSNGGSINIRAAETIILDGSISAQKGSQTNSGGSLNLTLDDSYGLYDVPPSYNLHIDLQQQFTPILTTEVFGDSLDVYTGQAVISADTIKAAGIDNLSLNLPYRPQLAQAPGEIRLIDGVNLTTGSSVIFDAQHVSWVNNNGGLSDATINTGYLKIGSSTLDITDPNDTPTSDIGTLTANANFIDLQGSLVLNGFSTVSLNSQHDMRTIGGNIDPTTKIYSGSLTTAGDLNLQASQLYPSTLTQFTFNAGGQINISGHNTDHTPLSAAGSLTFNGTIINQAGVVKAPLGSINFNATDSLYLNAGSVTSVSAEGLIMPFGSVVNNVWLYPFEGGNNIVFNMAPDHNSLGKKYVSFNAPNVQFNVIDDPNNPGTFIPNPDPKTPSIVNVAGGGDLTAATFQPGPGGDYNYLMPGSPNYNGGFAIIPSFGNSLSAYDPYLTSLFAGSANFINDPRTQVYLSGNANLAAGFYTELPSYYALLPGAYLVTPQNNSLGQSVTTFTTNGLPIVSGYQTLSGTNIQPALNTGYLLETSAQVQKNSQYLNYSANQFFANQSAANHVSVPLLPIDSGQISINASTQLVLDGLFKVAAPNGGRGAKMDISSQYIDVVDVVDPTNPSILGLQISAQALNNLHVDSLLLGGNRTYDNVTGVTNIAVTADTVTFDTPTQTDVNGNLIPMNIQALDLMAVGNTSVNVQSGVTINASGHVNTGDSIINIAGDSAILRVSADKQIQFNRVYDPAIYTPDMIGLAGDLLIDAGATLSASQSMLLGASYSTILNGNISMLGGSINMAANMINVGDVALLAPTSLNLTNDNLTSLVGNDLVLTSLSAINFYGDVGQVDANGNLQPIQFNHLTLDATSLSGYAGAFLGSNTGSNIAGLKANTMDIQNSSGNSAITAGTGTGILNLQANQFNVGKGNVSVDGFNTINITADKQFTAAGNSVVTLASDLNITAGLVAASGGHSLSLDATGHNVTVRGNGSTSLSSKELGGSIAVAANSINLQGANFQLPSGTLKLYAQTGDIKMASDLNNIGTNINLAGQSVKFADLIAYTPGGTFSAIADNGSVSLATGSSLDISSGGGKASGGNLILKAPNQPYQTVELIAGSLKATGASASIDVGGFIPTQFDSLMNKLMVAGVNQSIYVRSRGTDIVQNSGNTINAKTISLVSDAGSIDISGTLSTDNKLDKAGNISLFAGNNITLESGSLLSAKGKIGGNVLLSALGTAKVAGGTIRVLSGSTIDVTGTSSAVGTNSTSGNVTLEAMRNVDPISGLSGINIQPVVGTVSGAKNIYAVGFQKYDASQLNPANADITVIVADLSSTIPVDIANYLLNSSSVTALISITDTDALSLIISQDISNYFANALTLSPSDIAGLSSIINTDVTNYMTSISVSLSPDDLLNLTSAIATEINITLAGSTYSTDINSLSSTINADINTYMANATTMASTLGSGIILRPGVEIDNAGLAADGTGAMTLVTAWDFSALSTGTDPSITSVTGPIVGDLIVRAAGALNINAPLTDGYLNNGVNLMNTDSWSFQLVSGADLSSADTMATNSVTAVEKIDAINFANNNGLDPLLYPATIKDITIGSGASVHTGTGDVKLASGGNFVLFDQTATVYTGGKATLSNPQGTLDNTQSGTGSLSGITLGNIIAGDYPIDGGELIIQSAENITGAVSNQFIRGQTGQTWLGVQGHPLDPNKNLDLLTAWSINASKFQQNVGSFGGGAVNISAQGNINDLSVMMPTSGKQLGTDYSNSKLDVQGGGLMTVVAGGDISGGAYYLGQGVANLSAGGQINGSKLDPYATDYFGNFVNANAFISGPQFVMGGGQSNGLSGNTQLNLSANQGVQITGVSDVMVLQNLSVGAQFFSYTDASKLSISSLGGDINLNSDTTVIANLIGIDGNIGSGEKWLAHVYPASLDAIAYNGSVVLNSDIILYPSALGNVNVLAKQGINSSTFIDADGNLTQGLFSITMSDANTALIANAYHTIGTTFDPTYAMFNTVVMDAPGPQSPFAHANKPLHLGDSTFARFVAQSGDISSVLINMPKQTIIQAGNDVINSPILIQQNNVNDASLISATNDIKFTTVVDLNGTPTGNLNTYRIQVSGPGNVLVEAGKNLDLGVSVGLTTVGNIFNSALAVSGANLNILVGTNSNIPAYSAFIDKYLVANPLYVNQYIQVQSIITGFMKQQPGYSYTNDAQAMLDFAKLTPEQTLSIQPQLIANLSPVFYNELKLAGTASASDKAKGNAGGYAAIDTLFPVNPSQPWQGDLAMPFSKIQTVSGGDINLFAPGGQVDAGLAVAPSGLKSPDQLGIVAQTQGAINAFVKNNFTVNTSRVFTLGGGDIEIWSSEADIDAGKGAKSALAVTVDPPYFDVVTNQLVIPAPKITTGSGIRTAAAPGQLAGNVFLFAPKGIVNAGEAGIAGNNVTISATAVMGGNNIQVGGVSTGVPQASSGSLAAGLTGASNLTANVTQVAQASAEMDEKSKSNNANNTLGMLSVELLGFGE